jgi:hypothetical protein
MVAPAGPAVPVAQRAATERRPEPTATAAPVASAAWAEMVQTVVLVSMAPTRRVVLLL